MGQATAGGTEGPGAPWFGSRLVGLCLVLLAVNLALAAFAAHHVWTGVPDRYPNQQLRLLAGAITQVFLVGALVALGRRRIRVAWILIALCGGAVVSSIVLAAAGPSR